jgi:hypothetical protein
MKDLSILIPILIILDILVVALFVLFLRKQHIKRIQNLLNSDDFREFESQGQVN